MGKHWPIVFFFGGFFFAHSLECSSPKQPETHFRFNLPNKAKFIGECRQKGKMNSPLPSRFFCTCHKKKTICVTKYWAYHHFQLFSRLFFCGRAHLPKAANIRCQSSSTIKRIAAPLTTIFCFFFGFFCCRAHLPKAANISCQSSSKIKRIAAPLTTIFCFLFFWWSLPVQTQQILVVKAIRTSKRTDAPGFCRKVFFVFFSRSLPDQTRQRIVLRSS